MNNILNGHDKNTMAPDADIRRSEICTILIKCLFDMDENIPVIIANIEENTEAVPVDRKSTRLNSSHPTTSPMPSSA